jgi:putative ABC transport system permease protein
MSAVWRDLRRARARTITCIVALALAIGTIGVFAVPSVASTSLRRLATQDHMAHLTVDTTSIPDPAGLATVRGVDELTTRVVVTEALAWHDDVKVVGMDFAMSAVDRVTPQTGRLPRAPGEVVVSPDVADALDGRHTVAVGEQVLRVVGVGETSVFAGMPVIYTDPATATSVTGASAPNQIAVRVPDPTQVALDRVERRLRHALAAQGVAITALPLEFVGGAHPMEEGTTQISTMIGMLGIVAGIVALVLLASTTNAIVTERSREASVMRALGGSRREVRRTLRRVALAIAVLGAAIGIPLGILVSNVIARMVLEKFAGVTPGLAVSVPVMLGSLLFAVVGARLISGRAARRVTRIPLVEALRDRDGAPFGRRLGDRLVGHLPTGGAWGRLAVRSSVRRRGRAIALVAQVACAVGAAVTVASLGTSVANFNRVELASWTWETTTTPRDPGYPYSVGAVSADTPPGTEHEAALYADGRVGDWDFDVWGVDPATSMLDTNVDAGHWLDGTSTADGAPRPAVMASHIADQLGYDVGDTVTMELATGPARFVIVGEHPIHGVSLFVARDDLAAVLGAGGRANVVWTRGPTAPDAQGVTSETVRRADLYAEDKSARTAVLAIFMAIGVVVVGVATLGVVSTIGMSLYERRHELALLRALGGRRSHLTRLVALELAPLAIVGLTIGTVAGYFAAMAIMSFFEASSGIDLGYAFATGSVTIAALAVEVGVVLVARMAAGRLVRRSPAVALRTS